jgi:hypothetical protein
MDWTMFGAISAVVIAAVGGWAKWLETQIDNKIMRNNDALFNRINGKYVDSRLQDEREDRHQERFVQIEREIGRLHTHHKGAE